MTELAFVSVFFAIAKEQFFVATVVFEAAFYWNHFQHFFSSQISVVLQFDFADWASLKFLAAFFAHQMAVGTLEDGNWK